MSNQNLTTAQSALTAGTVLHGTYLVHERIATGGMGEVFLATHVRMPGKFAVKILNARMARDRNASARFSREAAIVAVLRHPNIVQIYDFNVTPDGLPFIVMEHLEGRDLAKRLTDHGPIAPARVARIVQQMAAALEAAHVHGIVHRDLKPANVMLLDCEEPADFVKLLDFGVSKIRGGESSMTGQWTMLGTPSYMAPEQVEGRSEEVDGRTDQFSLAVLTYVLLTGTDPFPGTSTGEVLSKIVNAAPVPMQRWLAWDATLVESVVLRALSKRRDDRYDRVLDFAAAFSAAVKELPGGHADAPPVRNETAVSPQSTMATTGSQLSTVVRLHPPRPEVPPVDGSAETQKVSSTESVTVVAPRPQLCAAIGVA